MAAWSASRPSFATPNQHRRGSWFPYSDCFEDICLRPDEYPTDGSFDLVAIVRGGDRATQQQRDYSR